jgi:hypothetical protein
MKGMFDTLKIDGTVWYAHGEYRLDDNGYKFARINAMRIRKLGKKARIIKRVTGYQVYSDDKNAVMEATEGRRVNPPMGHNVSISKRFWDNRKRNHTYSGWNYIVFKDIKLPSHEDMDKMDKYNIIYDVDPDIRNLIIELNASGIRTRGSCAGHHPKSRGFVTFEGELTDTKKVQLAKSILIKYGLKNVRVSHTPAKMSPHDIHWWGLRFNPIGIHTLRKQYIKEKK